VLTDDVGFKCPEEWLLDWLLALLHTVKAVRSILFENVEDVLELSLDDQDIITNTFEVLMQEIKMGSVKVFDVGHLRDAGHWTKSWDFLEKFYELNDLTPISLEVIQSTLQASMETRFKKVLTVEKEVEERTETLNDDDEDDDLNLSFAVEEDVTEEQLESKEVSYIYIHIDLYVYT